MDTTTDIFVSEETPTPTEIPHNPQAEEATIGCVLVAPETYSLISLILVKGAEEFYIHRNRYIFEAFAALAARLEPIDLMTVSNELLSQGLLAEIGGSAYLTKLIVPSALNAESYAKIVHGDYVRRMLINAANNIATIAYGDRSPSSEIVDKSVQALRSVITISNDRTSVSIVESVKEMDRLAAENAERGIMPGIPTGIIDLDKLFGGGMQDSDLLLIAGRPGDGKTSLLLQWLLRAARNVMGVNIISRRVGIFSMEMPHAQLTTRMLSQLTGIDYQAIRAGRIPDEKYQSTDTQMGYYDALDYLSSLSIEIDDTPARTPEDIAARCEVWATNKGLDAVFIDSLNLMRSLKNFGNRKDQQFDDNATLVKEMIARNFNIPVVMSHQMNRSIDSRGEDSEPILSDLREGGEQPSDIVLFISNKKEGKVIKESKLVLAKHRNGPTGIVPVIFRSEFTRFENAVIQTQRFN